MIIKMADFCEFQNTAASKKQIKKECSEGLSLRFSRVKSGKHVYVTAFFSLALVECMKKNRLCTFKMLFNQKTNEILMQYDNSTKAINLDKYQTRSTGIAIIDKFVTYTMLPLIPKDQTSIKYTCEYNDTLRCLLCTPKK